MSTQQSQRQFIKQFDTGNVVSRSDIVKSAIGDEMNVRSWLTARGCEVSQPRRRRKWDLIVNGKRVEVKSAIPTVQDSSSYTALRWQFNIHRHGVLNESDVDFYIFRLNSVPGFKAAIHLVIPAPIGRSHISMTLRSLIIHWGRYANDLTAFGIKTVDNETESTENVTPSGTQR